MSYIGGYPDVEWSSSYDDAFVKVENFQITIATASMCASSLVLLTGIAFYKEMVHRKIYMFIIMQMSFSDLISNISAIMGFCKPGVACRVQAVISVFFTRASWLWCLTVCATLYSQLIARKIYVSIFWLTIIVWGLNLIVEVTPFMSQTHVEYGTTTEMSYPTRSGKMMCSLTVASDPLLWRVIAMEGPIIIVLLIMMTLLVLLFYRLELGNPPPELDPTGTRLELVQRMRKVIKNILFYPTAMVVSWFPVAVVFIVYKSISNPTQAQDNRYFFIAVAVRAFGYSFGLFLGIVFFARSTEAQRRWYELINAILLEITSRPEKEDSLEAYNSTVLHASLAEERIVSFISRFRSTKSRNSGEFSDSGSPVSVSIGFSDRSAQSGNTPSTGSFRTRKRTDVSPITADFEDDDKSTQSIVSYYDSSRSLTSIRESHYEDEQDAYTDRVPPPVRGKASTVTSSVSGEVHLGIINPLSRDRSDQVHGGTNDDL